MSNTCKDCRNQLSVRKDLTMQSSKPSYKAWGSEICMLVPDFKGISRMKLHRELGITERAAWQVQ